MAARRSTRKVHKAAKPVGRNRANALERACAEKDLPFPKSLPDFQHLSSSPPKKLHTMTVGEISRLFPISEGLKMGRLHTSPVFATWDEAFAFSKG